MLLLKLEGRWYSITHDPWKDAPAASRRLLSAQEGDRGSLLIDAYVMFLQFHKPLEFFCSEPPKMDQELLESSTRAQTTLATVLRAHGPWAKLTVLETNHTGNSKLVWAIHWTLFFPPLSFKQNESNILYLFLFTLQNYSVLREKRVQKAHIGGSRGSSRDESWEWLSVECNEKGRKKGREYMQETCWKCGVLF